LYADVFAKTYGLDTIGLRYFNIFGPKQSPNGAYAAVIPLFMQALKDGQSPIINGDGEQTRDFTYVDNAVQANIKSFFAANEASNAVYNIACGEQISLNKLWEHLKTIASSKVKVQYGPARQGDVRDSLANISKAKTGLGYEPEVHVKEGLKLGWEWFNAQK
jgi:UDP-N-acetylglucosamine 4-epimerase